MPCCITSMAMQQGGMGIILTFLIISVPLKAGEFFLGTLGNFTHYSIFGGAGGQAAQPGPQGQPAGSYQAPASNKQQTQVRQEDTMPFKGNRGNSSQPSYQKDVIKRDEEDKR